MVIDYNIVKNGLLQSYILACNKLIVYYYSHSKIVWNDERISLIRCDTGYENVILCLNNMLSHSLQVIFQFGLINYKSCISGIITWYLLHLSTYPENFRAWHLWKFCKDRLNDNNNSNLGVCHAYSRTDSNKCNSGEQVIFRL